MSNFIEKKKNYIKSQVEKNRKTRGKKAKRSKRLIKLQLEKPSRNIFILTKKQ